MRSEPGRDDDTGERGQVVPFQVPHTISDRDFRAYQRLVFQRAGIHLSDVKRALLMGRVSRRMRSLRIGSFKEYFEHVSDPQHGDELVRMLDAITTNETAFFREPRQFEFLERVVFPGWILQGSQGRRPKQIRAWSAACSTGEEPYSLAMFLLHHFPPEQGWSVEVLASDICTEVLGVAEAGVWPIERGNTIPNKLLKRYMMRGVRSQQGLMAAGEQARSTITFRRINLNDTQYPVQGDYDLIFVRNVFIYFNDESRRNTVQRLLRFLSPNGYIFLGHAETLNRVCDELSAVAPTVYSWPQVAQAHRRGIPGRLISPPLLSDRDEGRR